MALSGSVAASINMVLTSALDLQNSTSTVADNNSYTFTNGTGANNANNIFSDQRTLAASATEDLDLAGSLTNAYGATITFTKVKAMMVFAAAANTNDVEVGGAAVNGFNSWVGATGDKVLVKPGGCLLVVAPDATGYAVTAGTGDLLTITNSAGSTAVTYDVILLGVE